MRKEDKLRPYRVDYFNIDEMEEVDQALVRSSIVRAVTSAEAAGKVLADMEALPVVLIRSYRFYKPLGFHKKGVYKAVEDLFTEKNALIVMEEVEKYRANRKAAFMANEAYGSPSVSAPGHVTRYSDSSLYDEVCTQCGATDARGDNGLDQPCPAAKPVPAASVVSDSPVVVTVNSDGTPWQRPVPQGVRTFEGTYPPSTGPESAPTKAVVADLQGMISHDAHEQAMDTFKPTNVPEGKRFPDPTNMPITLAPVPMEQHDMLTPVAENCPQCETTAGRAPTSWTYGIPGLPEPAIEPDQAVGPEGRPPLVAPACDAGSGDSLLLKVAAFATITLLVVTGILYLLHH